MVLSAGGLASTRHFSPAGGKTNAAVICVALSVSLPVCAGGTANSAVTLFLVMLYIRHEDEEAAASSE